MSDAAPSVLITGANGFVGARLCRYFLKQGFRVIAGVRKSSDLSQLEGIQVEYRYGDVTQAESLPALVEGVAYVIHNAGIVKARRPESFFAVNEKGTRSLLAAIESHASNIKKFIYISSLAAAGPCLDDKPLTESVSPHPVTTYGKSKLAGERVVQSYASKIPVVIVRPSGVYGPGDKEVFSVFQTADRRIRALVGDLNRKLQMVYVDDLCYGVFLAATGQTESGSVYFLAERETYAYGEWVETLQRAIGKKGFPLVLPAPVFRLIAALSGLAFKLVRATPMLTAEKANELLASWEVSIEKAERELGYSPEVTFAEGAAETYRWYKNEGWL